MKVITCFSYKGGAGRTTAAANIAAALASLDRVGAIESPLKQRVAIIDLDVFSAGTHSVFQILTSDVFKHRPCVQDYLHEQMAPNVYLREGAVKLDHPLMAEFRICAAGNCHPDFTLLPARPDADAKSKFVVQKQHENVLLELLMEMENQSPPYDYVILDGESGTRQMADIALRLADVVLLFFRLTWQHIDGTLEEAKELEKGNKQYYLIPTCVPLVSDENSIYLPNADGLSDLRRDTKMVPELSKLNTRAAENPNAGHFWNQRHCIHDSLRLRGAERVIVFENEARNDPAARDYYHIAAELTRLAGTQR